jgi:molybdopterin-binding protein
MLELKNINYETGDFNLKNISFKVKEGEYFVLLGPSGAGKSVLLELIAGLTFADSGNILFKGKDYTDAPAWKRPFGLVFQDLALFPHLKVFDNIAYSLKRHKLRKDEINKRVEELSNELGISDLLSRKPDSLSGGEQQRVALARTLALKPSVLLLDEPLSAVDISLQHELRALLRMINRNGVTIIHVTHSFEEALAMAQQVSIIEKGTIIHSGTTHEVFERPKSAFIANLSGHRNFFKVRVSHELNSDLLKAEVSSGDAIFCYGEPTITEGFVLINQENIVLSLEEPDLSTRNNFHGIITDLHPSRHGFEITIDAGIQLHVQLTAESVQKFNLEQGGKIWACFKASSVTLID